MRKNTPDYHTLYQLTCDVTPLDTDCGLLCKSICCRSDFKHSLGVYLFPGEEELFFESRRWYTVECHHPEQYDFPENWTEPVYFIKCQGPCPREARPLACRFFPLAPHLLKDGTLLLIHETAQLPYQCPLITEKRELKKGFIDTVALAWKNLIQDPLIRQLVEDDSRERENSLTEIPMVFWSSNG